VKRIYAAYGVTDILEQCHRFYQSVELIAETYFSRAGADRLSLRLKFLLPLLRGTERLRGKVGITCGCGSSLHSRYLIGYR
jgi:hypothetical protein